jgi:hypothetical protein
VATCPTSTKLARPGPKFQRVDEGEIAVEAVEYVLPGPHRVRESQQRRFAAGIGAHQIWYQPLTTDVTAANHVACEGNSGRRSGEAANPRLGSSSPSSPD